MDEGNFPDRRYYGPPPDDATPPGPIKRKPKPRRQAPQETIKQFWDKFNSGFPGKVFAVLPDNVYAQKKAAKTPKGAVQGVRAAKSYEEAKAECEKDVCRIIRECRRTNQKYRDPHFDIEWDLKLGKRDCLDGLSGDSSYMKPRGVKRVPDIFEDPQFYIDDPTAGDVRQGRDGDCYLMAALCGLGNMKGLIEKICVKHDPVVGVYGFVFYRDGEWQQTIVDDKLYLRAPDYDDAVGQEERLVWDDINRKDSEEEYRKAHQTGSRALYFAQCSEENETWLPLLEKAFAKAHGDYSALDGGFTGEAIEDLTGGVTSEIYSADILDKNAFWTNELMKVNQEFLFGCATGFFSNWLDTSPNPPLRDRQGIFEGHAYSIMEAREVKGYRLLKLRNPWGKKEWQGKWSDGSPEWTAEWMQLLDHKFGNDGIFWINYEDLLKKYQHFDRTRIFGPEWHVNQIWTSVHVPWTVDYHTTKFRLTLKKKSPVVIVLEQLDDTFFRGLEGAYEFDLQFRLENDEDNEDYIVRSHTNYAMARSVSTDIELEAGQYSVLMKITATRTAKEEIEEVLPVYATNRREKLIQMGLSYDLAHAKGIVVESQKEKEGREKSENAKKAADREAEKQKLKALALKRWERASKRHDRDKRRHQKRELANERRRGQRSSISRCGDEGSGSLDAIRASSIDGGTTEIGKEGNFEEQKTSAREIPIRLKSFTGEPIPMPPETGTKPLPEASPDAEQDSVASAVAETIQKSSDASLNPTRLEASADSIVAPLDTVIATADEHTSSSKPNEPAAESKAEELPPTPTIKVNGIDVVTDVAPLPTQPTLSTLDAAPDDLPALAGGNPNGNSQPSRGPADGPTSEDEDLDETSSIDSFPSFDWCTDIDMSSEDDIPRRTRLPPLGPLLPPPPPPLDDKDEDGPPEPWNAVVVVGLRVYSLREGDEVLLEVVRATGDDDEKPGEEAMGLDRDDPNKSLVEVEGQVDEGEVNGEAQGEVA